MTPESFDNKFKSLVDAESSYGENVSFEAVMERRKKKRRGVFWWKSPAAVGIAILAICGVSGYMWKNAPSSNQNIPHNIENNQLALSNARQTPAQPNISTSKIKTNSPLDNSGSFIRRNMFKVKQKVSKNASTAEFTPKRNKFTVSKRNAVSDETNTLANNKNQNTTTTGLATDNTSANNQNRTASVTDLTKVDLSISNRSTAEKSDLSQQVLGESSFKFGFDALRSRSIRRTLFNWNKINWELEGLEFDAPQPRANFRTQRLPWFVEFSAITGSNNTINFDEKQALSILGTQYMAQYQLSILREFENSTMWGIGFNFTEWVGNGQWRHNNSFVVPKYDTSYRTVWVAGRPPRRYRVIDTSMVTVDNTVTGNISYRIDKIALPVSFRYQMMFWRTPIRFGMQVSPGITTVNQGNYFTQTDYRVLNSNKHFAVDGKVSLGPMIPINRKFTFIIEPSMMYQSFLNENKTMDGKFFGGLGLSLLYKLK